jgi:hypothetical protein
MSFIEKIFKKPLVENFDFTPCSGPISEDNYNQKVDDGHCAYAGLTGCLNDGDRTSTYPQRRNNKCTNTVPGGGDYHVLQSGNYIGRPMFGACACPCTNSADCSGRATAVSGTKDRPRDEGGCRCTCIDGWEGDTCNQAKLCTRTDCSGNGEPRHHQQDQGCTPCICDQDSGWGGNDCSEYTCNSVRDCSSHGNPTNLGPVDNPSECTCSCNQNANLAMLSRATVMEQ